MPIGDICNREVVFATRDDKRHISHVVDPWDARNTVRSTLQLDKGPKR